MSTPIEIPVKRLKSGFELPVLGIGTWRMGGDGTRNPDYDDAKAIAAIEAGLSLGIRHIDTAELYAQGEAEKFVAQALRSVPRNSITLASKVWKTNLGYEDLKRACKSSLDRLKTDYLDLYYVHAVNPDIPLEETMRALNELWKEGLIRNVAVSNFSKETLAKAQSFSEAKIVANQVHYNLKFREPEKSGLLDAAQKDDYLVVAWRPLQYGDFADPKKSELLARLAVKYEKTPAQIALNWLICQEKVVTLFMSTSVTNIKENLGAFGWELSKEDRQLLTAKFPEQQPVSDRIPLQ